MNKKIGICTNYEKCILADLHHEIDSTESNFFCTECSMPLRPVMPLAESKSHGGLMSRVPHWVQLVLCFFAMVGVGGFTVWRFMNAPFDPESFNLVSSASVQSVEDQSISMAGIAATTRGKNNTVEQSSVQTSFSGKLKGGTPHVILRLHGSNTVGAKLALALVESFMKEKGYAEITTIPTADLEVQIQGKKPNTAEIDAVEIKAHGSHTAFDETDKNKKVGMFGGYCDIGMSSSPVKKDIVEKFLANKLGDLSSRTQEHVIALDGLGVIVNPKNAINQLSVEKIRKIFLGEITDWSAVGGSPGKISLYSRDHQSGTYDTFKSLVLSGKELDCGKGENLKCFEDSKELSANVASDVNGIGFIGLNYIGISKPLKISMAESVKSLAPNRVTIKTEDYPLGRRLFLYQTNQSTPLAADFIQFVLSSAGQDVVAAAGSVNLNLDEKDKEVAVRSQLDSDMEKQRLIADPGVTKRYKELIWSADRIDTPLNFRFQSGSIELDNRAFRDIGRLSAKLTNPRFSGAKIILIGFSDPKGDPMINLKLSEQRALKVKEQLESEGLKVEIATGFGEEPSLLLDPREDDPASLAKNRRVEVWILRKTSEVSLK